ncbi:armadillo repeat containing 1, like isoform X2 [Heterodontus francisci]|uniref:armadillo repeat containing 1, like isoform X2 n=1 Tax=Heterodontus francisci TaxID=7792 RepID=UPI00355BED4E
MDALSVVIQLRDLASEPQNREAIVKDKGCLPGLVLLLDDCNLQVLHCALQALRYLAECPSNRVIMKNELEMMNSLERLQERDHTSEDISVLATEIYELLKKPVQTAKVRINNSSSTKNVQAQFFINSTNKKAKTITLQIEGLHNMSLASAIAATKILQAHQVVKNESGEEAMVPLSTDTAKVEQNLNLPDYLPEDESPEKEHDEAISQTGAKRNMNGTWLNAAANFLTKTFYW